MESETKPSTIEGTNGLASRGLELEAFSSTLSLDGSDIMSRRVFNVWGEPGIGKTTFIKAFRDSELMENKKTLLLYPTEGESIETIEEFIAACAETVRYPSNPAKEEIIQEKLENVQRGKVNPILSDDSILIARSSIATNKKPYVNKAAAASVGRTEFEREDLEVNIGLGENKADNHAEGFLDALPLQSLGTDVIFLILGRMEDIAIGVKDWLRDYVIPAASKGPYRRNLSIIIESESPINHHQLDESWGEWETATHDFRLYPLSEDAVYELGLEAKIDPGVARFAYTQSLGYPQIAVETIQRARRGELNEDIKKQSLELLENFDESERIKIASCCLPQNLYPEEMDAIYGKGNGSAAFTWLRSLKSLPISEVDNGKTYRIDDNFRWVILENFRDNPTFKSIRTQWSPYGRITRNAPSKTARAKLIMLSGLNWLSQTLCRDLFGDQAAKVEEFIANKKGYFVTKDERYRINEYLRKDLGKVAGILHPVGSDSIHEKAAGMWSRRKKEIQEKIDDTERASKVVNEEIHKLTRKQIETNAHLRVMKKKSASAKVPNPESGHRGTLIALLFVLSFAAFATGMLFTYPANFISAVGGLIALLTALGLIPSWRNSKTYGKIELSSTTGIPITGNLELTRKIRDREIALEELKNQQNDLRKELSYSYVEDTEV